MYVNLRTLVDAGRETNVFSAYGLIVTDLPNERGFKVELLDRSVSIEFDSMIRRIDRWQAPHILACRLAQTWRECLDAQALKQT